MTPYTRIDHTPDGGYALRILRRYREDGCNARWEDNTTGEPSTNPLLVEMNRLDDLRVAELDRTIALLERGEK